jgi:TetR/AcrR family transcriptional regulator
MTELEKQTEEKIFEAATDVFLDKGMDGARMQDIANHAGINKALLHYYYRTKDHLFNTVFELMARKMLKKFAPVFDENLTLEEKIRFFFREHIKFMQENPRLPAFVLNEINRNPERIAKLIKNIEFEEFAKKLFEQHKEELKKYNVTIENLPQIMTSIAAISVFPFAAKGLIEAILGKFGYDFDTYIENRKEFAPEFVINALKKHD